MADRSYHIPGGPRVTETGSRSYSYQIPGGPRITFLVTLYGPYVEPGYVLPDYVFSYNLARPIADVSNSGWRGVLV